MSGPTMGTNVVSSPCMKKVTIHCRTMKMIRMNEASWSQIFSLSFNTARGRIMASASSTPAVMIMTPVKGLADGSCSVTQTKDGWGYIWMPQVRWNSLISRLSNSWAETAMEAMLVVCMARKHTIWTKRWYRRPKKQRTRLEYSTW